MLLSPAQPMLTVKDENLVWLNKYLNLTNASKLRQYPLSSLFLTSLDYILHSQVALMYSPKPSTFIHSPY